MRQIKKDRQNERVIDLVSEKDQVKQRQRKLNRRKYRGINYKEWSFGGKTNLWWKRLSKRNAARERGMKGNQVQREKEEGKKK